MSNYNQYSRGSEWRRWDLHIHSDASDGKMTCEEIIEKALERELDVIALTDHHTAKNIDKIISIGNKKGISVIPGIEFRTDKGKRSVHIIGLFPLEYDGITVNTEALENLILSPLKLSNTTIIQKGRRSLEEKGKYNISDDEAFKYGIFECQVNFEEAADLIHNQLGGLVVVHAGSKSNSLENEIYHEGKPNTDQHSSLGPLKKDLFLDGYIDVCEINRVIDNKDFYLSKFNKPSIIGSDAHKLDEIGNNAFWIKADPTFEGLKQVLYEPDRVWLEENPPKLLSINSYPENFIDKLIIKSKNKNDEWFDNLEDIKLNTDLISIIGNKGNGKSALADIIGACGNANTESYSFLNKEKFLKHPSSGKYSGEIVFKDKSSVNKSLSKPHHDSNIPSRLIYFSQSFVKELCDDEDVSRLQDEIDRVIFSHIPAEARLGTINLSDLVLKKTKSIDKQIFQYLNKLNEINEKLEKAEHYLFNKDIKEKWKNTLQAKYKLLEEIKTKKPKEVQQPKDDDNMNILDGITEENEAIKKIEKNNSEMLKKIKEFNEDIFNLEMILSEIEEYERGIKEWKDSIKMNKSFAKIKLNIDNILSISVNKEPLKLKIDGIRKNILTLDNNKNDNDKKINRHKQNIQEFQKKLTHKQKEYNKYKSDIYNWEKRLKEIEGDEETKDTIKYLKKWIHWYENELPSGYNKLLDDRGAISKEVLELIFKKKNIYPDLFSYAKKYADQKAEEYDIDMAEFLQFDSRIQIDNEFSNVLFSFINQKYSGTFHTEKKGYEELQKILDTIDFNEMDDIANLPRIIIKALEYDISNEEKPKSNYNAQIISGRKIELYNFLFGFEYLNPRFSITYGGKSINYLSPGEKGTLLLIFYLLIDKDKRPIIIDQPEENLDNETVYKILVKFIKKVKQDRQIIIVTHNPNLAIVCDSEQIIYCHINKESDNLVNYTSGSIENFGIREKAINILEGTEPAFKNRKDKYEIR